MVNGQINNLTLESLNREFAHSTFYTLNSKINGSPYINNSYQKVKFLNTTDKEQFSAKYNAYHDLIEVKTKTGKKYFPPKIEHQNPIQFLATKEVYKAYRITKNKTGFFRVLLTDESLVLLKREVVSLINESLPQTSYHSYRPATFKREKDKYYIYLSTINKVVKLPSKRSKFLKLFKDKSEAIKNYIKKEKLSIKKEKDIITIYSYYLKIK
jgi:hypothetical protein